MMRTMPYPERNKNFPCFSVSVRGFIFFDRPVKTTSNEFGSGFRALRTLAERTQL